MEYDWQHGSLSDDPERWPLLTRASRDKHKAVREQVEWLADGHVETNLTQIFREPFSKKEDAREALYRLFDSLEYCLRDGKRATEFYSGFQVRMMGGVLELIHRWPHKTDGLHLAVLRPLELRTIEVGYYGQPLDNPTFEFLFEGTLIAVRGK